MRSSYTGRWRGGDEDITHLFRVCPYGSLQPSKMEPDRLQELPGWAHMLPCSRPKWSMVGSRSPQKSSEIMSLSKSPFWEASGRLLGPLCPLPGPPGAPKTPPGLPRTPGRGAPDAENSILNTSKISLGACHRAVATKNAKMDQKTHVFRHFWRSSIKPRSVACNAAEFAKNVLRTVV